MKEGILQGLRVLDLTRVAAGPYTTRILADFGAEVIKIQTGKTATGAEDNVSGYFNYWNRNKKSISIDLHSAAGAELARKLAASADIVAENFKPGTMTKYGLDYEALSKVNERLIFCQSQGFPARSVRASHSTR